MAVLCAERSSPLLTLLTQAEACFAQTISLRNCVVSYSSESYKRVSGRVEDVFFHHLLINVALSRDVQYATKRYFCRNAFASAAPRSFFRLVLRTLQLGSSFNQLHIATDIYTALFTGHANHDSVRISTLCFVSHTRQHDSACPKQCGKQAAINNAEISVHKLGPALMIATPQRRSHMTFTEP
eukprot:6193053-Pleurochrysis_carterae.AAC.2